MIKITSNKFKNYRSFYDKNGYIVIRKFINKEKADNINDKLTEYLKKNSQKLKGRKINYVKNTKLVSSVHNLENIKEIKNFSIKKKLLRMSSYFLREKSKNFGSELFAKPARYGKSVPIHQDNYYWNINNTKGITIWISLNGSNKKNGALSYYKKSHKIGLLEHTNSFVPGSSQVLKYKKILKYFKKVTPNLKKGDALLHNSMILHGSEENKSNKPRLGLTLRYIPESSKINWAARRIYEKNLKKQRRNNK